MTVVGVILVAACASGCGGGSETTVAEPPPPKAAPPPAPAPTLGPELVAIARSIEQRQTEAARRQLEAYLG